jgi:hypothetical protein
MRDNGAAHWRRVGGAPRPSNLFILLGVAA